MKERSAPIIGLFGSPWVDLDRLVDSATLEAVDEEVSLGLARVEVGQTGGTLKWMGVVAPWQLDDGYKDAMEVLRAISPTEYATFLSLTEDPATEEEAPQATTTFGDETERPFTLTQMRWLSTRHGVYFPWRACYHLLENDRWEDKHSGAGKAFSDEAREHFPKTLALIEQLPFTEVGRAVIFGLEPNDHAPLHRDTEPGRALSVAQSISIDPRGDKRFYLQNAETDEPLVVTSRVYWFNDMDYHGVLPDPAFRYSIRIDGVFDAAFLRSLERGRRR